MSLCQGISLGPERRMKGALFNAAPRHPPRQRRAAWVGTSAARQQPGAPGDTPTTQLAPRSAASLAQGAAAAAAIWGLLGGVAAAQADTSVWKPRRHHRHIGERFTDTWAEAIVEAGEESTERIRGLERQLRLEKKRADEEAAKRAAAESRLRVLTVQQAAARPQEDDSIVCIRVLGADVTGPLLWLALVGGGWLAYSSGAIDRLLGRGPGGRRAGRWVRDRSLGGKQVWLPDDAPSPPSTSKLAVAAAMSDGDFEALAGVAAARAPSAAKLGGAGRPAGGPYQPPGWWRAPPPQPAGAAARAEYGAEASRLVSRLEAAKNRGQDYELEDILSLRRACRAGGGLSAEPRTVGTRDAIFRFAADACIRAACEPGSVDLGGEQPLPLLAGLASDLGLAEQRGVKMLCGWVAGAVRSRIVEAIAALSSGDDLAALLALAKLVALLDAMPVLAADSPELELIAGELNKWADVEVRNRMLILVGQIAPQHAALVAHLLDFDPAVALPRMEAALRAAGGGAGPQAPPAGSAA